jgi:aminoglycoside 6'-N-acetyltransferase
MLGLLSKALFEIYGADVLVVDPKTHNARAIACYRKSGFTDCFVVPQREAHFGELFDSLIMYRRKLT